MLSKYQKELKRSLISKGFKFVVIFYNTPYVINDVKEFLHLEFSSKKSITLKSENSSYEDLSKKIYDLETGFVFIDDFENVLNNDKIYLGFNQRRDKFSKYDIQLITFMPLYDENNILNLLSSNLPDLWEFRTLILRIEKELEDSTQINNSIPMDYSSLGGLTSKEKKIELNRLFEKLKNNKNPLNTYIQISIILSDLGEYEESLVYQLKSIKIREEQLGLNHPLLATSYNNLSATYLSLRNYKKALDFQLKAIEVREKVLDKNHPDLAESYTNLSTIYMIYSLISKKNELSYLNKALVYQNKAIKIMKFKFPDGHPDLDEMLTGLIFLENKIKKASPKKLSYKKGKENKKKKK